MHASSICSEEIRSWLIFFLLVSNMILYPWKSSSFKELYLISDVLFFSRSVMPDSLLPYGLQHARLPCPSLSPEVCSDSCPLSQWCHPTISSSVTLFSSCPKAFPALVFPNKSAFHIRWPKYWSFSFSTSPSNEHSGLISRMDWFDLLAVQGSLKTLLQHYSSKASILPCSAFLMVNSHIHGWLLEKP